MGSQVIENFSGGLFRAFSERTFAEDFVRGRFRLGRLAHYRSIEDASRRDGTEGEAFYLDEKGVSWWTKLGNDTFTLCCSLNADLAFLRHKLGRHIVQIHDPEQLATDTYAALGTLGVKVFQGVSARLVRYDKGQILAENLDEGARADLCVVQKPPEFREEMEYRFFAILSVPSRQSHIDVEIPRRRNYLEIVR